MFGSGKGAGAKPIGDKQLLQRRIPRSPTYDRVRSTVDSGASELKRQQNAVENIHST